MSDHRELWQAVERGHSQCGADDKAQKPEASFLPRTLDEQEDPYRDQQDCDDSRYKEPEKGCGATTERRCEASYE